MLPQLSSSLSRFICSLIPLMYDLRLIPIRRTAAAMFIPYFNLSSSSLLGDSAHLRAMPFSAARVYRQLGFLRWECQPHTLPTSPAHQFCLRVAYFSLYFILRLVISSHITCQTKHKLNISENCENYSRKVGEHYAPHDIRCIHRSVLWSNLHAKLPSSAIYVEV
jgi:hypothetical protein